MCIRDRAELERAALGNRSRNRQAHGGHLAGFDARAYQRRLGLVRDAPLRAGGQHALRVERVDAQQLAVEIERRHLRMRAAHVDAKDDGIVGKAADRAAGPGALSNMRGLLFHRW